MDSKLHPWLLEVNGTPSLAVEHGNPEVEALIRRQKVCVTGSVTGAHGKYFCTPFFNIPDPFHVQQESMVTDMVNILNLGQRFTPRYTAMRLAASTRKQGGGNSAAPPASAAASVQVIEVPFHLLLRFFPLLFAPSHPMPSC